MNSGSKPEQPSQVLIVGGGIIGLCVAYFAAEKGSTVTLIDHNGCPGAASGGNAGLIVPSRCKPLPSPQTLRTGLASLLLPGGPLTVSFRPELELFRWLLRFVRSSRRSRFEPSREILLHLGRQSLHLYNRWLARPSSGPPLRPDGILFPYFSRQRFEEARKEATHLGSWGFASRILSPREACEAEPALSRKLAGAILKENEGFVDPAHLLDWLKKEVRSLGVAILEGVEALWLQVARDTGPASVVTTQGEMQGSQIVVAAGARSRQLLKPLGIRLPLQEGKGYSLSLPLIPRPITRPVLAEEAHLAMTPLQDGLRVTGMLELCGPDTSVQPKRLQGIMDQARRCLPELGPTQRQLIWRGFRPCTPDGLPLVGRLRRWPNLWIATGHVNLGLTLGPATGRLLADMLAGTSSLSAAAALSPERFRL